MVMVFPLVGGPFPGMYRGVIAKSSARTDQFPASAGYAWIVRRSGRVVDVDYRGLRAQDRPAPRRTAGALLSDARIRARCGGPGAGNDATGLAVQRPVRRTASVRADLAVPDRHQRLSHFVAGQEAPPVAVGARGAERRPDRAVDPWPGSELVAAVSGRPARRSR